jgi:hypothetical protein
MRVLEARFHPLSKQGGMPVTVARVLCDRERTFVEPMGTQTHPLHPFDGDALMKKVIYLVESAKPRPYEQLTALRSQFWSFTKVSATRKLIGRFIHAQRSGR